MTRDYIFVSIIIILSITCFALYQNNNSLRKSLAECNTMMNIQNESIKQQAALEQKAHDKVRLAQKKAAEHQENSQKELKKTYNEEIKDKTCEGSFEYLLNKATHVAS